MKNTENYGFNLPEKGEFYNVEDFNENFEGIDGKLKEFEDGTTPVGDSNKLGGKSASEYALDTDLANYFKNTGGTIKGNVAITSNDAVSLVSYLQNSVRSTYQQVTPDGAYHLYDKTNNKSIISSTADGTNTFNGTASGNLPINSNGKITRELHVQKADNGYTRIMKNNSATADYGTRIYDVDASGKQAGFSWSASNKNPYFVDSDGKESERLHTGNKPTGTYTGNGSATQRTIATGGTGYAVYIGSGLNYAIVTPNGYIGRLNESVVTGTGAYVSTNGIILSTTDELFNANGKTYTYQVL